MLGLGAGAVGAVEEWLDLVEEQAAIAVALAAAVLGVGGWGVLGHAAQAGVGDADEDEGLDAALGGELVCGGVGEPGMAGEEGGAPVEEILAVVQVQDREAFIRILKVLAGEVDEEGAVLGLGQEGGVEAIAFEAGDGVGRVAKEGGGVGFGRWRRLAGYGRRCACARLEAARFAARLFRFRFRYQPRDKGPFSRGWG